MSDVLSLVRGAQRRLATCSSDTRSAALRALASLIASRDALIDASNQCDLADVTLAPQLRQRLRLSSAKRQELIASVTQLASWADPLGEIVTQTVLDDGLTLDKVKSPIGVVLVIFESRPDAVIQIASLAIRSGNAVVLKGGAEAAESNRVLVACVRDALAEAGLDPEAVTLVEGRAAVRELLNRDDVIDLVIPRGSNSMVRSIQESTRIPVLGHAEGICHLYLDALADTTMAVRLAVDGKCDYPAACNATETILVHASFLDRISLVCDALFSRNVEIRGDERLRSVVARAKPASDADFHTEHGALIVNLKVVDGIKEAIAHIQTYGSAHTDAICTSDVEAAERFLNEVDSASVFHNASTRFADGYRYGLGAEVGVSTSRIHARGPVGVDGLMTTRWLLRGSGQVVSEYSSGERHYKHERLKG
ncbi:MAG: glutamate-5-semialdehyde dehydrogenase [Clostridia bacterium]|nr:glutamate-5-semialdehyde dehydrogenase [Deltaproteobacteria bacterium]